MISWFHQLFNAAPACWQPETLDVITERLQYRNDFRMHGPRYGADIK
jgi:hypothetical protein